MSFNFVKAFLDSKPKPGPESFVKSPKCPKSTLLSKYFLFHSKVKSQIGVKSKQELSNFKLSQSQLKS